MDAQFIGNLAVTLLSISFQVKLYHWRTSSYAQHKATDKFIERFNKKIDLFIEVMQGIHDVKLCCESKNNTNTLEISDMSENDMVQMLVQFSNWLQENKTLNEYIDGYTDLMSLRDDMLAITNQTLYRFTLV